VRHVENFDFTLTQIAFCSLLILIYEIVIYLAKRSILNLIYCNTEQLCEHDIALCLCLYKINYKTQYRY